MKPLLYYFIQVICISSILYGYYHLALRNKKFHRYNRFYLLAATFLSITIPFLNIPLYFTQAEKDSSFVLQTLSVISSTGGEEPVVLGAANSGQESWFTFQHISYLIYILIAFIIFIRIIFSLLKIKHIIRNNPVEKVEKINFVHTEEPGTPFSFFRWLFWNRKIDLSSDKGEQIFKHEVFHIEQKHSWDIMYIELLVAFCWFNPFFHLMKKEMKAIHEFLADQFAVKENKQWEYAELLLMQALSTQQQLVNPFFHNQIKRRIAMITTSQKPRYQYLRKILVLPIAAIAVALFAFSYKNKKETDPVKPLDKPITVVIDAGHGGEDAGAYGPDGTSEKNITLAIAKKVKMLNEDKNLNIILTRDEDNSTTLHSRTDMVYNKNADLFISIHVNSAPKQIAKDKNGIEVFISGKNQSFEPENKILATIFLNYFSQLLTTSMEIKQRQAGIWVLDNSPCPAAIIECGYLTNKKDLNYITNPQNQDKMAKAILDGIDQYFTQKKSDDWEERKKVVSANRSTFAKMAEVKYNNSLFVAKNKKTNNTISFEADSIIFKKDPNIINTDINEALYIINGKQKPAAYFTDKIIFAKRLTVYEKNDATAIKKYGKEAINGVMVFEDVTDIKPITIEASDTVKPNNDDNKVFDKVEIPSSFPGGDTEWRRYLERNVDGTVATKNKAPGGVYTVIVQFIVDKEGNISDVRALTKHGYGMEQEAIRAIKLGPKWIPAKQNGHVVKAYRKQPITFQVIDDKKGEQKNGIAEIEVKGYPSRNKNNNETKPTNKDLKKITIVAYKNSNTVPMFPGGKESWLKYLTTNARANTPVDNGAPSGIYKTIVQFLVHKDGSVSGIKAITNFGYGMERESIRLIEMGPKWVPATENGKAIDAYVQQPVTFQVADDFDDNSTQASLFSNEKAITEAVKNIDSESSLYPNPSTGIVKIQFYSRGAGSGLSKVINQSGKVMLTSKSTLIKGLNTLEINTSSLSSGVYIITVIGVEGIMKSYKMIRQ